MRLFVYYVKNGMDVFDNVERVSIKKKDNKNTLFITFINKSQVEEIFLSEIEQAFLVKIVDNNCEEYFRYEK